jgi:hypothetical protein
MEIQAEHVEWAVVSRLRDMLHDSATATYDVTQTYAFFSTIIQWTVQRMRTKGQGPADIAARRFHERMEMEKFAPFAPAAQINHSVDDLPPAGPIDRVSVADFMIAVRNGSAHGDGRSVKPLHRRTADGRVSLVGFSIPWEEHSIILSGPMMITLGTWLADEFILAMRPDSERSAASDERVLKNLRRDIRNLKEARH